MGLACGAVQIMAIPPQTPIHFAPRFQVLVQIGNVIVEIPRQIAYVLAHNLSVAVQMHAGWFAMDIRSDVLVDVLVTPAHTMDSMRHAPTAGAAVGKWCSPERFLFREKNRRNTTQNTENSLLSLPKTEQQ